MGKPARGSRFTKAGTSPAALDRSASTGRCRRSRQPECLEIVYDGHRQSNLRRYFLRGVICIKAMALPFSVAFQRFARSRDGRSPVVKRPLGRDLRRRWIHQRDDPRKRGPRFADPSASGGNSPGGRIVGCGSCLSGPWPRLAGKANSRPLLLVSDSSTSGNDLSRRRNCYAERLG